jgi:hypothetical protein
MDGEVSDVQVQEITVKELKSYFRGEQRPLIQ